jgi:cysteine-rich repeat protein
MRLPPRLLALSLLLVFTGCPRPQGNRPPVATGASLSTPEDTPVTFTLAASDPEGKVLTITPGAPSHGSVSASGASFTYTPGADFFGLDTIPFSVSDGTTSVQASVDFTVTPVNDAPVAVADTLMGSANIDSTFEPSLVLANDTDIDGDALAVTAVSTASAGRVSLVGGRIRYQPLGTPGDVTFSYTLSDGTATATGTVTLTLSLTLRAPVALDDSVSTDEDVVLTLQATSLLANDVDLDGAPLALTAVGNATHGTVALASGVITFSPDPEFSGTASFDYTVSDGALTDTGRVTVTVAAVNDGPLATDDLANTPEDTALTLAATTLLANDLDVDGMVALTAVSNASNGTVTLSGASIVFTPTAQFNGAAGFDYTVTDGMLTDTGRVVVSVSAVNDAPLAMADTASTAEDTALVLPASTLLANDTDLEAQQLTLTSVRSAVRGTVTLAGNAVTFQPESNYVGPASFGYTVSDGTDTASAVVSITVTAVNDAPLAVADVRTGTEDVVITLTASSLLANDSDVEGSTLTLTGVGNATNGTVSLSGPSVVFTPTANFSGTAGFEYTVSDGSLTDTGRVTVNVAAVNDPPVATDDTSSTAEDTPLTLADAALLLNDGDPDGPSLSVTTVGNSVNGTVSRSLGVITFTPSANFAGTASFEYSVGDGTSSDVGLVTVTVTAVNDAPLAVDDVRTTAEDTALILTSANLTTNDVDVDGPSLSVTAVGAAVGGTVSLSAGSVTFTPAANFFGAAGFEYTVSDGSRTDVGAVEVTVSPVDDRPVANADSATTNEDTAVDVSVLANDPGLGDGSLVVSVTVAAGSGTATVQSGNVIRYTPSANFFGSDSFTYQVADGDGDVATATVSVTVTAVDDAPTAAAQSVSTNEAVARIITLAATDVDSATLTFSIVSGPTSGTLGTVTSTGPTTARVTYTPTGTFFGADSFTFRANDGALDSAAATVSVTVVNVIVCGDGNLEGSETCDAVGTPANGDGCSSTCTVEAGWTCAGAPSVCTSLCGDLLTVGTEQCDDGNSVETDGCTTQCRAGRVCTSVGIAGGAAYATDPATGVCYANFSGATTWSSAQSSCLALGGHLAVITSASEQAVVGPVVLGTPWLGATDDANDTDAVFDWVTTDGWGYTHFAAGEPDDDFGVGGGGECLAFVSEARWADTNCDLVGYTDGRVCEFAFNPCGDGLVESGEVCDDGNRIAGDGCSATCTVESGATCNGTAPTTCSKLVINEIDYDQPSNDNTGGGYEFVELLNVGTASADLTAVALVLINASGASPTEYFFDSSTGAANVAKRVQLTSAGVPGNSLPPGGFIVVSVAGLTTPLGVYRINVVAPAAGFIQNGSPDAVALVRFGPSTVVLDGFSYEGSTAAAAFTGVAGTFAVTEGAGHAGSDPGATITDCVARVPNGRDTDNNSTDFVSRATCTPGAPN